MTHHFELELNTELNYYFDEASFSNQEDFFPSIAIQPEYNLEWNKAMKALILQVSLDLIKMMKEHTLIFENSIIKR